MSDTKAAEQNDFSFVEMEKKWLKHWDDAGIIDKYLHKNDNSKDYFSFLDGPITANNPMGVHHAWGRSYKDLWQKYNNLHGKKQRFQNGFDCQGLWVEVEVEKELKLKSKKDIENLVPGDAKASVAKFVQMCKDRVLKFSAIQTAQSQRLAYFMDWDHSYFTMSDNNNYMIWRFLKKCHENGWIYKGRDSVPWCPRCETAISQHEMLTEDYKELTHETVFFKLPVIDKKWEHTYLLVWTTTPWTIPANVAVGVNISFTYGVWKHKSTGHRIIFIAKDENEATPTRSLKNRTVPIHEYIFDKTEGEYEHIQDVKGSELVGLRYTAPFDTLPRVQKARSENEHTFHIVVDGSDIVVSTEGTGLLHVAPGAGQEDFQLGKKEGLPIISVIADNADYLEGMDEYSGKNAKKHPELIIDHMRSLDSGRYLLKTMHYTHRYPACWRCKSELVWKVADEWYIAMDLATKNDTRTLRERMMDVARQITWMPEFGLDRELDWLKNMHDWLISKKNRYWGLSLPIYECPTCETFEVLGSKEELQRRAIKGWDQFDGKTPHKPYIDEVVISCPKCSGEVYRIEDVGNPWLDAGIVPYSTIADHNQGEPLYTKAKKEWQKWFPADFISESFPGQFKNWFYAMIAESTVLEDCNPYKRVLGFATLLGEDGRAMHKSWGNSIEFNEGADKIGVDVMRWMFARHNPADNMLFGYKKADEVRRQFYIVLWNVYRYYLDYAKLDGYVHKKQYVASQNILDIWLMGRLEDLKASVNTHLQNYNARDASVELELFVNDVSTWYIRRSRNRVWNNSSDDNDKQSFYATLHKTLVDVAVMLSPIMPFISEEIFTTLTGEQSVHLSTWPALMKHNLHGHVLDDMSVVREVVEVGNRVRKEIKIKVRQPLASATITLPKAKKFREATLVEQYSMLVAGELNVKNVIWKETTDDAIQLSYDTTITEDLKYEGELRELVRKVQALRKAHNLKPDQKIKLIILKEHQGYINDLKKHVMAETVTVGDELRISE